MKDLLHSIFELLLSPDIFTYFEPHLRFLRLLGVEDSFISFFPDFPDYKSRK
jgi:hypothetical protein